MLRRFASNSLNGWGGEEGRGEGYGTALYGGGPKVERKGRGNLGYTGAPIICCEIAKVGGGDEGGIGAREEG